MGRLPACHRRCCCTALFSSASSSRKGGRSRRGRMPTADGPSRPLRSLPVLPCGGTGGARRWSPGEGIFLRRTQGVWHNVSKIMQCTPGEEDPLDRRASGPTCAFWSWTAQTRAKSRACTSSLNGSVESEPIAQPTNQSADHLMIIPKKLIKESWAEGSEASLFWRASQIR